MLNITYKAIAVYVVNVEAEPELFLFLALGREYGQAANELLRSTTQSSTSTSAQRKEYTYGKVDHAIAVFVKDFDDALGQRVISDLRNRQDFLLVKRAAVVFVDFGEALVETLDLLIADCRGQSDHQTQKNRAYSSRLCTRPDCRPV